MKYNLQAINVWKAILLIPLFIASFAIAYHYLVVTPKKLAYIKSKEAEYDFCMKDSEAKYNNFWMRECKNFDLPQKCALPKENLDRVDASYKQDQNLCLKKLETIKQELEKL